MDMGILICLGQGDMSGRTTLSRWRALGVVAFIAAANGSVAIAADLTSPASCAPTLNSARTEFPHAAQNRGDHGTVQAGIKIGADGVVHSAKVVNSSGHMELDRAATNSIQKYWQFDVKQCSASE